MKGKSNVLIPSWYLLAVYAFLLEQFYQPTNAYCWEIGRNPGFSKEPTVYQISPTRVRVSWEGIVTQLECADSFLVFYWKENNPSHLYMTAPVSTVTDYIDIDVSARTTYLYQVIARENKSILGVDDNKAEAVKFRTSYPTTTSTTSSTTTTTIPNRGNGYQNPPIHTHIF